MSNETGAAKRAAESRPAHRAVVWTLIVVGTVVMILSTLNSWVERRVLDTDTWVRTSTDLLADDAVRQELSVRLVNALYENVDVGPAIDERLPEQLKGLGDPLAGVLRNPLIGTTDRILQTEALQVVWGEANRAAHTAVVAILEDDVGPAISTAEGNVVIDLSPALRTVGEQIGLPEDVLNAIPADAAVFEVVESDRLARAQNAVRVIKILGVVFFVVVVGLFAAAIYLASNWRRQATRNVGFATAIGGLVVLVALRAGIGFFASRPETSSGGRDAFNAILTVATALLRQMAWSEILIGLLVALGASLVGPARYAQQVRRHLATGFAHAQVATWIGLVVLVLAALVLSPFSAGGNWATVLIVLGLVVVGVEALRRTSLAEEARRVEEAARKRQDSLAPAVAAVSVESGADRS